MLLIKSLQVASPLLAAITSLTCLALPLAGQEAGASQPDPLEYVQSVSAMTGRPIFAVAGQST
ncbi:MAG: hypothetical protein VYE64_12595 [Planctomycetota bacterium]|nr:hypothetical protein [Planctomycetota bacterium]